MATTELPDAQNPDIRRHIRAGASVRVTQQIAARHYSWPTVVEGTIVDYSQRQTGSWYAHSRGEKLWLDRLVIRKADGEISTLNLDEFSKIEITSPAPAADPAMPDVPGPGDAKPGS